MRTVRSDSRNENEMTSCVVEPRKSEAICPTNIWRDLKWYLSDNGEPIQLYLMRKVYFSVSDTGGSEEKTRLLPLGVRIPLLGIPGFFSSESPFPSIHHAG